MDGLLTKQNIFVANEQDRVILSIGRLDIPFPYAAAFKVAAGLKNAAKHAMRISGEDPKKANAIMAIENHPTVKPISTEKRQTLTGRFEYLVGVDKERIMLRVGNVETEFHFETALKIASWMRANARNAKRWAGDGSQMLHGAGWLSDANANARL